ncbi:MAG: hypothetical protein L6R28_22090 [Planctomycetes bacterium]|nr:hypothetical protein [Planctomycetota bacterium]
MTPNRFVLLVFAVVLVGLLPARSSGARDERLVNTFVYEADGKIWQITFTRDQKYILQYGDGKRVDGSYVATSDELALVYPNDAKAKRHFSYSFLEGNLNLVVTTKNRPSADAHALNDMPPARDRGTWMPRTAYETMLKDRAAAAEKERLEKEAAERAAKEAEKLAAEQREREAREALAQKQGGPGYQTEAPGNSAGAPGQTKKRRSWGEAKAPADLPEPMQDLYDEVGAEVTYRRHREAGDKSFLAGDWQAAHDHYAAALELQNDDEDARKRLNATGGWLAMLQGDAAREKGDWRSAKESYHRAVVLYPPLRSLYGEKVSGLNKSRHGRAVDESAVKKDSTEANLEERVLGLVKSGQYDEAAKIADAATVLHPESAALLSLEDGVANYGATRSHATKFQALLARAGDQAKQAAAAEPRGELPGKAQQCIQDLDAKVRALEPSAKDLLIKKDYARLKEQPEQARALTGSLRDSLVSWQTAYAKKAQAERDANDLTIGGIFKVKRNQDTEKSKQFDAIANAYGALAEDASTLLRE